MIRRLFTALLIALVPLAASAQILLTGVGSGGLSTPYFPKGAFFNADAALIATSAIGSTDSKKLTVSFWMFGDYNVSSGRTIVNGNIIQTAPLNGLTGGLQGTIAATVLTVTAINKAGTYIIPGQTITGTSVTANSVVQAYGTAGTTGTGGIGTYVLSQSSTVSVAEAMTASGSNCEVLGGGTPSPGLCLSFDSPISVGHPQFSFNDVTGTTAVVKFQGPGQTAAPGMQWNHYTISFDAATGVSAVEINGNQTLMTASVNNNALVSINHPAGFGIGNAIFGTNQAIPIYEGLSDVYINPGYSIACTGVGTPYTDCPAANTLSPSLAKAFYNNGPVDLGTNCALPSGSQPPLCYRFAPGSITANDGSLGNVLSATLLPAIASVLQPSPFVPMPYGPGGIPAHVATVKWVETGETATNTSMTTYPGNATVSAGDFVAIQYVIQQLSGTNINVNMVCPTDTNGHPWTPIGPFGPYTVESEQSIVCYKIMQAGDDLSGAYTAGWNAGITNWRGRQVIMVDVVNVASVDIHNGQSFSGSFPTSWATPAGTTSSANETLLNFLDTWSSSNGATKTFTPPANTTILSRVPNFVSGNHQQLMATFQTGIASGSSTIRTFSSNVGDEAAVYSISLVPN